MKTPRPRVIILPASAPVKGKKLSIIIQLRFRQWDGSEPWLVVMVENGAWRRLTMWRGSGRPEEKIDFAVWKMNRRDANLNEWSG